MEPVVAQWECVVYPYINLAKQYYLRIDGKIVAHCSQYIRNGVVEGCTVNGEERPHRFIPNQNIDQFMRDAEAHFGLGVCPLVDLGENRNVQ